MIGDRLKLLRNYLNKTQLEFANFVGIKRAVYNHYENDKRDMSLKVILAVTKASKCNTHWLLTGEGTMFGDTEQENVIKITAYKVGDTIELISGSKPMTIIRVNSEEITCTWPNANDDLQKSTFPSGAVRRVK